MKDAPTRIDATPQALDLINRLVEHHGPVMFDQSGGCCDGSSPMCFPHGEFRVGSSDVQLGEVGGAPFFMSREQFEASTTLRGANLVGSPAEVAEKILFQHDIFRHQRLMLQFSVGTMAHADIMRSIELYGTRVAPAAREEIGRRMA